MKKIINYVLIALILLSQFSCSAKALDGIIKFQDGTRIKLEVAVTQEEKAKGLMNRDKLDNDRGMVFVFRPKQNVTFWMKDTLISLDMIFIEDGKVVNIAKNAIPNQTDILYPSNSTVTEVVEVNAGFADEHNLKIGDKIAFYNIAQIDYSKKSILQIFNK